MSATTQERRVDREGPATDDRRLDKAGRWARRAPLLPALIFTIILTQLPFVVALGISFMNWNSYYPDDRGFAGVQNFVDIFTDTNARNAVVVTIILTASVVILSLLLGLGIALLLDRPFRGRGFVRTMMITPFLVVPVAAALLWKHALYNPEYGLLNGMLTTIFGDDAPQPDWITNNPLISIIVALVWQWTPFMMLILLAGLQSRPLDVVEAARIDGASSWQIFTNMTLPHLRRYIELAGLLGAIYVVQNFDHVFTITGGGLGTANLPYYIYETFYIGQDYGRASAAGVITVIGTLVVASLALRTALSIFQEDK
ncbi:sugar ABC transporter permease [Janibacter melonis]|uniref:carbohydrate ABC transporter permease n=1 Tax=Janibacter melonis TaxID=262209 RepID=UPI0020440C8E|nr:sugar ABC transporter permease [Janibacter melonis]MCM3555535.1 sugar ABC transporter permease [Janibacter melonis]